jgi:hypothetical protein
MRWIWKMIAWALLLLCVVVMLQEFLVSDRPRPIVSQQPAPSETKPHAVAVAPDQQTTPQATCTYPMKTHDGIFCGKENVWLSELPKTDSHAAPLAAIRIAFQTRYWTCMASGMGIARMVTPASLHR